MKSATLTPELESIVEQISRLPVQVRETVCDRIEETLPIEFSEEERAELDRRIASVLDGTAVLIPWEEAIQSIRQELHEAHKTDT
jgi:hypothetical protein